jgi:hypothetical protein
MTDRAVLFPVNTRTAGCSVCLDVRKSGVLRGPNFEVTVGDGECRGLQKLSRRENEND